MTRKSRYSRRKLGQACAMQLVPCGLRQPNRRERTQISRKKGLFYKRSDCPLARHWQSGVPAWLVASLTSSYFVLQLLIDGKFVDAQSGKTFATLNPRYSRPKYFPCNCYR